MKKRFTFSTVEHLEADLEDLQNLLRDNQQYYENYQDILGSLEDDDYVARGNGFCDRKYSDDFIEGQLEKYAQRVKEIQKWIAEWKSPFKNLPLSAKTSHFYRIFITFLADNGKNRYLCGGIERKTCR